MSATLSGAPVIGGKVVRQPQKLARVKNKSAAELQITAEQLLREAKERQLEIVPAPPKQKIQDAAELADYQMRKRKEFEDLLRRNRTFIGNWMKYAKWEEQQEQVERARSVYERALDVDHRNVTLWIKYAEMEMRNKQVNHARNLWDRAVTILPRVSQFWYKYVYMEEMLENVAGCRQIFERWMEWEPIDEQAWLTYIKFEMRYKEIDRARVIYRKFIFIHPDARNWIRFAKFEEHHGFIDSARSVYEQAVDFFGSDYADERLYVAFARFEENLKEYERAKVIYKYGMSQLAKKQEIPLEGNGVEAAVVGEELSKAYTVHEKKFGSRCSIEKVITEKRRAQYEAELEGDSFNYDAWFDLIRLISTQVSEEIECLNDDTDLINSAHNKVREVYERAIANIPPSHTSKLYWRRYIYLWINYAIYEELDACNVSRARQAYQTVLQDVIPHKSFTFAKIWLLYAQFEIRQRSVKSARQILGTALGKCPKGKIFKGYIHMEIQLREFSRCRILYEKFLEFDPTNCSTWIKFAELESLLGDYERCRSIYGLAVGQSVLDMPELLWKSYIDFEIEQGENERVRKLYEQLLSKSSHVKVWLSYAQFETSVLNETSTNSDEGTETNSDQNLARSVYKRANASFKNQMASQLSQQTLQQQKNESDHGGKDEMTMLANSLTELKQHRVLILEKWLGFERLSASSKNEDVDQSASSRNGDVDQSASSRNGDVDQSASSIKKNVSDSNKYVDIVERLLAKKVKKRRKNEENGGVWEEYYDYIFPEDQNAQPNLKLLAMAKRWRKDKDKSDSEENSDSSSSDEESSENQRMSDSGEKLPDISVKEDTSDSSSNESSENRQTVVNRISRTERIEDKANSEKSDNYQTSSSDEENGEQNSTKESKVVTESENSSDSSEDVEKERISDKKLKDKDKNSDDFIPSKRHKLNIDSD